MAEPLDLPVPAEDPPGGPEQEYDPAFIEMRDASESKAERQYGQTLEPAVPPDWKSVATLATELLGRGRNLRVMVLLAAARLNLNDMAGYAAALATIRQHIETMWEHVHPRIDPEDTDSPFLERSNILRDLTNYAKVLAPLRDIRLAEAPRLPAVRWRDIAVATGAMDAEPGRDKLSEAQIRGTFAKSDPAQLATLHAALDGSLTELAAIRTAFAGHATPDSSPGLDPLEKLIRTIRTDLARYEGLAIAPSDDEPTPADAESPDGAEVGEAEGLAGQPTRPARAGRTFASIRAIAALDTRDDALHALALAATYFRVNEPSSPLPLLIDRAARLAPLSFMDILRDLAPDGMQQAQVIAGRTEDGGY